MEGSFLGQVIPRCLVISRTALQEHLDSHVQKRLVGSAFGRGTSSAAAAVTPGLGVSVGSGRGSGLELGIPGLSPGSLWSGPPLLW